MTTEERASSEIEEAVDRFAKLDRFIERHGHRRSSLIEVLQQAQEIFAYLDRETLAHIADSLNLPPSHVYGVATFYNFFRLKKPGQHIVTPCLGTACHVKKIEEIVEAIEEEYDVELGESTADGRLSLFGARCIGACAMAPNVIVDGKVIGKATKEKVLGRMAELLGGEDEGE